MNNSWTSETLVLHIDVLHKVQNISSNFTDNEQKWLYKAMTTHLE